MSVSHDVLAAVFLDGGFGFDPVSLGRLVAIDRTCRQLAGSVWLSVRLCQVRRLLDAYYSRILKAYGCIAPPTVSYMLLSMNYLHVADQDGPVSLAPLRFRLAEQIKRILGTAETVTAANCGSILLELDASTPVLACAPPESDCESDDVPSDAESAMSYDVDRPHADADIETWGAYWNLLVRRRDYPPGQLFREP